MDRAGFREFLCLRLVAAGAGSHVWVREICGQGWFSRILVLAACCCRCWIARLGEGNLWTSASSRGVTLENRDGRHVACPP